MGTAKRIFSTAIVTALAGTFLVAGATSASALTSEESQFVSKINYERRARGVRTLAVKSDLVSIARRHSARMAREDDIWHNRNLPNEVSGNWWLLGENVGMGPSVGSLHKAFMDSYGHRKNILNARYNQIGVGVVLDGNTIFVTEVFAGRSSAVVTRTSTTTRPTTVSTPRAAAPAPTPKPAPVPPKPQTVDLLVRMIGLDAERVDPTTGQAAAAF